MLVNNLLPPLPLSDRPLYATLVQFPAVCFVGTLLTDPAYWRTDLYLRETFSVWLLTAGCVLAGITGIVGLVEFIRDRRARTWRWAWPQALLSLVAALLAVVNAFVHSCDGYTAVVPDGITLSAIVVVLMAVVVWMGWNHTHRDLRIGVTARRTSITTSLASRSAAPPSALPGRSSVATTAIRLLRPTRSTAASLRCPSRRNISFRR